MNDLEQRLNELVSNFINDVSKLARQSALDTLSQALAGVGGVSVTLPLGGRRGRGKAGSVLGGARAKGAKRAADEIEMLKAQVHGHIQANPGQRIEQINAELGTTTADLSLPLKKLIADGAVRTEGDRRATKYFPGEGTPRAASRKRRKKKD